jgi:TPR repeat protein
VPTRVAPVKKRSVAWPYIVVSITLLAVVGAALFYKQNEVRALVDHLASGGSPAAPVTSAPPPASPEPPILVPKVAPVAQKTTGPKNNAVAPVGAPPREAKPKPVSAQDRAREIYEAATEKRREGEMEDAIALLGQAAALGDVNAMTELGEGYHDGDGVPQNQSEALRWYRRAADAGSSSAMVLLGAMYFLEDVPGASDEEAARWFQKAAGKGNPAAMYNLATMYETGRGVAKNPATALELFRRAAALGNNEAQRRLNELQAH